MDGVISGIKEKVMLRYLTILTDLGIDDAYLTEMVNDVVDRFLIYTRRDQLVPIYEYDLTQYPVNVPANNEYWSCYKNYPVPQRVYRTLAQAVVNVTKSVLNTNNNQAGTTGVISSLSDNGASVSFKNELQNFFTSADDSSIFSDLTSIVNTYRIVKIIGHGNTTIGEDCISEHVL